MLIETVLTLALMLLAMHWLCDYPLQGSFSQMQNNQARSAFIT
ncbi:hypothetical protein QA644_10775 [Rhizobium sp. CC1099]|nr:hypothetical protein [Rhizobium sp. CC1099]WFU89745.1 hypothetical protein QA644_10775 [Rhizobium sp. CC1099]